MKRVIASQLSQLKERLGGYVALLVYRYANLCIEANPGALMSAQVKIEGEVKRLEDVAKVSIHEKYHFIVEPLYEEDLFPIGQAIMKVHPEFKQEVKSFDGYAEEDPEGKFLFYTMPEVNKERHDILLKAVDAFYDECSEKMSAAQQYCTQRLAVLQANATPEEIEKTADYMKEVVKQYNDMRDTNRDDKKKEIEDAYAEYQTKKAEKQAQEQEQQQAAGNPMQMTMQGGGSEG